MIDIFNEVFNGLTNALVSYDRSIRTSSVYQNVPSEYPFVSLEEIDNSVYEETSDCCELENHAQIDFEINIWTKDPLKKSKGDGIANIVDNYFKNINFVRMSKNSFQSEDETKYRIIVRYQGIVSKDHIVYRR